MEEVDWERMRERAEVVVDGRERGDVEGWRAGRWGGSWASGGGDEGREEVEADKEGGRR